MFEVGVEGENRYGSGLMGFVPSWGVKGIGALVEAKFL